MPVFSYTALDSSGNETRGTLTADARSAALAQVSERGLFPVSVEEKGIDTAGSAVKPVVGGRVSKANVEAFTRQLANLLSAGVPLSRALHILSRETSQPGAKRQWVAVHDDVVDGVSLADALARHPRTFPPVYTAMVRAGEAGGFLDVVLEQIADFRAREQELKGKIKAALVYPAVLATLAAAVLAFLLVYFIPRFSIIFDEFGGTLPWLTQAIVSISEFVVRRGLAIAVAVVLAVLAVQRLAATDAGRRRMERTMLSIPAVGVIVARFALVRFCRMLGTLLEAGVPMISALRVAREAIGNQTLADTVSRAVEDVRRGTALSRSLGASQALFPAAVTEMVSVAEESGRLAKELMRIANAYESELDRRLRMLVALAEPALLFVMAAIVGTVVIGMLLPVFTLQELIQ